jgi:hypothetical protein
MQNKSNLDIDGNDPIVSAEFSSGEWGIDSRLLVSLPQKFKISLVNKTRHRQHGLQCWGLNPRSRTSSALLLELCP